MTEQHHHHHHRSPEQKQTDRIAIIIARTFFVLAFVALMPYFTIEFFPFLRAVSALDKVNVTTICYVLLRICMIGIPVIFILPSKLYKAKIGKISLFKRWFLATSFFFFAGIFVDIMTYNIFGGYTDIGRDPIMIKMLCGNIGLNGLVFCFCQGAGYYLLYKRMSGPKKGVVVAFTATSLCYMLMPIAYALISGRIIGTNAWDTWHSKNMWFFVSNIFMTAGLWTAAASRRTWSKLIWQ